ncbi:hypothetical protein A9Q89_11060 [Gammaproteobacteria bacterium 53_120_T64]|nr:hypothetical protein A9Q89_11060 [Gammaproteobacteria bacterium 53_120_T64]
MMASIARVKFTDRQLAILIMVTQRAVKPIWPAPLSQCIEALLLCAVIFEKLAKTDTFLKLHFVLSHS